MNYYKKLLIILFLIVLCSGKANYIYFSPSSLKSGDTLKIIIETAAGNKKFIAEFNNQTYDFYPITPKKQRCLIGLSCKLAPGKYKINLVKITKTKKKTVWIKEIEVNPGMFDKTKITLKPKKENLIFNPQTKDDKEKIGLLLKKQTPVQLWQGKFIRPLTGRISGLYGTYRIINETIDWGQHQGIDISAVEGAPVLAANTGKILAADSFMLQGNAILIDHGQGVQTIYMHLSSFLVKEGDLIEQGQAIGKVGSSGLSTNPHLHWGLYVHGIPVEPLTWTENEF